MSFSASTCLTNSGTIPLGGLFNIYSNVDQFFNAFQSNVTYSQLFNNCPYIMGNVPDGTTIIKIIDTLSKCCVTIDILSNDLCETCELGFEDYETNTVGLIVAGDLTGSCENVISDYRILWYGPDNPNQLSFTSGFGTDPDFLPRDFTHPLTGINSPMQPAGTYVPVIDKIKLNGLDFSQTGGTGYVQAELECFNATTVNLQPFTCDNGTEVGNYTHRVEFTGQAESSTPLTLQSTFDLDLTTNYFAWKFSGKAIPDSLKITFYGSAYSEPIILEYWVLGGDLPNSNVLLTTLPKSGNTSEFFSKVTSLTSLDRNVGDYLILEVIPNQTNPRTDWDFYFTCLEAFDCDLCLYDYLNTPYKIKADTIVINSNSCGRASVQYYYSGCTYNQLYSTDIYKYMETTIQNIQTQIISGGVNNSTGLNPIGFNFTNGTTSCGWQGSGPTTPTCIQPPNSNTITFSKSFNGTQGVINMTFSNLNDLIAYKSSYESKKLASGWINDPTNVLFYKAARLCVPNSTGGENCGDGTSFLNYYIHFSSIITTGQTSNNYTLTIPMPTITNQTSFTDCELDCTTSVNRAVLDINNSSNSPSLLKTTNTGSRYTVPFLQTYSVSYTVGQSSYSAQTEGSYVFNNSFNSTIPFSGNSSPYTQIPSLSAQTCDFSSIGVNELPNNNRNAQRVYLWNYKVTITNPPNLTSFTITANPIVNGVITTTNFPDTVATVINGVLQLPTNPLYTF
jgi:hypothetical protein